MIFIYRQDSKSATVVYTALIEAGAEAVRLRRFRDARPTARDLVVNWGAYVEQWPPGWRVLNPRILGNKFRELDILAGAGVPVPPYGRHPDRGWLARLETHYEANDLRQNLRTGDFYVQRVDVDAEFRFHIFQGVSIRQQHKVPIRTNAHPWIRSFASGWDWVNGGDGTEAMRRAAVRAVAALGLDWGAVDVGRLRTGGFVVFEVNTAPGIDPGGSTADRYAAAIMEAAR